MDKIRELKEEMFEDYLWSEWYDELESQAIREVEKELGFWKSLFNTKEKIQTRHQVLFNNKLKCLKTGLNESEGNKV